MWATTDYLHSWLSKLSVSYKLTCASCGGSGTRIYNQGVIVLCLLRDRIANQQYTLRCVWATGCGWGGKMLLLRINSLEPGQDRWYDGVFTRQKYRFWVKETKQQSDFSRQFLTVTSFPHFSWVHSVLLLPDQRFLVPSFAGVQNAWSTSESCRRRFKIATNFDWVLTKTAYVLRFTVA